MVFLFRSWARASRSAAKQIFVARARLEGGWEGLKSRPMRPSLAHKNVGQRRQGTWRAPTVRRFFSFSHAPTLIFGALRKIYANYQHTAKVDLCASLPPPHITQLFASSHSRAAPLFCFNCAFHLCRLFVLFFCYFSHVYVCNDDDNVLHIAHIHIKFAVILFQLLHLDSGNYLL